ncbi:hypothetical protein [Vagococcus lutrae]|uniref:hypothetical protein n=1 Tax=Vagococcus lutrae TaxID=81947 RepID=UPI000F86C33A|nr:hypothetical protein [Vagococcus lutrae]RST92250.1 hypothetical protein CBF33_04635 [Vagococcus lutrae]
MKIIRVPKKPSAWKGIRAEDDNKVTSYTSNQKKQTREMTQENYEKSVRRSNDLYLYCKKTYEMPSSKEKYAQIMKKDYSNFNEDYYIKIFDIFTKLIDNKNVSHITIEMFKDINNIFIQIEGDYSHEIVINVAQNLKKHISTRKKVTKKMKSLLSRCKKVLNS